MRQKHSREEISYADMVNILCNEWMTNKLSDGTLSWQFKFTLYRVDFYMHFPQDGEDGLTYDSVIFCKHGWAYLRKDLSIRRTFQDFVHSIPKLLQERRLANGK